MKRLMLGCVLGLSVLMAVAGCDSNPYPKDATITPQAPPPVEPKPEPTKTYELSVPSTVTCNEGILCTVPVAFAMTGDLPVISFENLPAGAAFDPASNQIRWVPAHEQVSDQLYVVFVNLRGNEDTDIHLQRAIGMMVKAVVP